MKSNLKATRKKVAEKAISLNIKIKLAVGPSWIKSHRHQVQQS